ncbi:type II toxin-antitoxin system VapC family toxin [Floridanema aerugineum]|uniref:Type II toxin-antitoxin system VapC family toxin n=1 Tax=Floridaenema aerugineum BLCC-F46 TaxID=3153654 RepID=A0ABV4XDL9_9CYAN
MRQRILLDTGPLVASLNRRDKFHQWVKIELTTIKAPLLTCEAVLSEACFLLRNFYPGQQAAIALVNSGLIQIPFCLQEEAEIINELMTLYQSVPMSLADACLVRMAEQYSGSTILTFDRDFLIYRQNRNEAIPLIMPENT